MRILVTADPEMPVPPSFYGGIERVIYLIVTELQKRGQIVGLIAHKDSTTPADQFFPWPGLLSQKKFDVLRNTNTLWNVVKTFQPNLIHSFSRILYLFPHLFSSIPKIMSYQRQPSMHTVAWAARLASKTLTFTGCSEHISRQGRLAGGQWQAIHNCVDVNSYTFRDYTAPNAPLVFLSRIERIKGAHTAIAVARKTGKRLLIAGNHSNSGQEGNYWQEEILPNIGKDGIEYVGAVNDAQKNELLGQAAAMIVPIEWDEPFGIVFAEALACGTPVISCPRGALPEIVREGIDGFLVNNLVDACQAVENLSKIKRINCRQRAESCFSSSVIAAKYENLYHRLRLT
jgi:glycosyltransferase involved in cell wall biosynthesis